MTRELNDELNNRVTSRINLEFPPDCDDPWGYARKLPGGIKEIDIDETLGEIKFLLFEYQHQVYKLCNLKGCQPILHKVNRAEML